jgi:hypothetical protein
MESLEFEGMEVAKALTPYDISACRCKVFCQDDHGVTGHKDSRRKAHNKKTRLDYMYNDADATEVAVTYLNRLYVLEFANVTLLP